MSSGTGGFVSNFNDSGYSFTVPGSSGNLGDGMMLASILSNPDPSANLMLRSINDASGNSRAGANTFYPNPGMGFSAPTDRIYNSGNYRYGALPVSDIGGAFRRNQTVTGTRSDIYNFTNPGVYILDFDALPLPIPSSFPEVNSLLDATAASANGILVYPGWGFRAFSGTTSTGQSNFTDVSWNEISYIYFNDTNEPIVFTFAVDNSSSTKEYGRNAEAPTRSFQNTFISVPIMVQVRNNTASTNSTQNRSFGNDLLRGIQVFFRSATPLMRFGLRAS